MQAYVTCFRLVDSEEKDVHLAEGIRSTQKGLARDRTFLSQVKSFSRLPSSPFAYWASRNLINIFIHLPRFESEGRKASGGIGTTDDFRFIRCWWEICDKSLGNTPDVIAKRRVAWVPIAQGGNYSPYYSPTYAVINYGLNGLELKQFIEDKMGSASRNVRAQDYYFLPALTWPLRGEKFSAWPLPEGCVFSVAGKVATVPDHRQLPGFLALFNSSCFDEIVKLFAGKIGGVQYQSGLIAQVPIPLELPRELAELAVEAWKLMRSLNHGNDTAHAMIAPTILTYKADRLADRFIEHKEFVREVIERVKAISAEVDRIVLQAYSLSASDISIPLDLEESSEDRNWFAEIEREATSPLKMAHQLFSYFVGCCFGRFSEDRKQAAEDTSWPFQKLPAIQMTPVRRVDGSHDQCIFVDDATSAFDICDRVYAICERQLSLTEDILDEALRIVGYSDLRSYLRGNFFLHHLGIYSQSRRQSPVYLPLSTASGSYTVWLYYHRLSDQSLYTVVNDFVEPKQRSVEGDLRILRSKVDRTRSEERELESLTILLTELNDFRSDLLRIAEFWKPDLNDGVQISMAPFWQHFLLKKWRETLRQTWEELEEGNYDWAHLALSVWPERVVRIAHKDRSIAIAHALEASLWHEVEVKKTSNTGRVSTKIEWQPRELSERELDAIVAKVKSGEIGSDNAAPAEVANA